jgi:hypothetical protein
MFYQRKESTLVKSLHNALPPCRVVLVSVILLFLCLIVKVGPKTGFFRVSVQFHNSSFLYSTPPYLAPYLSITGYWFTLQMNALCTVLCQHGLKFTPYLSPFHNIHILPIHVNCLANNDTFSSLSRS